MHITPTKDGLSPFEVLFGRSYQIPELRHTPAQEAEDSLADYMRKTLCHRQMFYHHICLMLFQNQNQISSQGTWSWSRCSGGKSGLSHGGRGLIPCYWPLQQQFELRAEPRGYIRHIVNECHRWVSSESVLPSQPLLRWPVSPATQGAQCR